MLPAAFCYVLRCPLVAVELRLVRPLLRDADVGGLLVGKCRQVDAELAEMQPCYLLVEMLRQSIDADLVLVLPEV